VKNSIIAFGISVLLAASVSAQEVPRFLFDVGAGFTQPVGNTGRHTDLGWNVQGGFGLNFSPYIGAKLDLGYNHMGINSATLGQVGVPGGDLSIFSATLDPIVHLNPHGHFDLYLTGGGGLYHRTEEFTAPAVSTVLGFDPFFGFFPAAIPSTQVLASYTVNKPGVDGGAGIAFGTRGRGRFFAEARYNRIFMLSDRHSDYIPVTFGFRW
jgi:outer membrane protein with beta-barrel domain